MSNPYRSFICFDLEPEVTEWFRTALQTDDQSKFDDLQSENPTGSAWSSMGFTAVMPGEGLIHDLNGRAMLAIQINERVLPSRVRDAVVNERKNALEASERRKLTKKEFAELRDEVVSELLPKSFVKSTVIPVMQIKDRLLVFTSSLKRALNIASFLAEHLVGLPMIRTAFPPPGIQSRLRALALGGDEQDDTAYRLYPSMAAVLRGDDGEVIRVRDLEVEADDVQRLLKTMKYAITAMGITLGDGDGTAILSFTLDDSLKFTSIKFDKIKLFALTKDFADDGQKLDGHAEALLIASQYFDLVRAVLDFLGEAPAADEEEEDDEL